METKLDLNGTWSLREQEGQEEISCRIPGSVLSALLDAGRIQDPYWRTNEYKTKEPLQKDYVFTRNFTASEEIRRAKRAELVFEGIDTIGEVFLNGKRLGRVKDMHRTWRFPVTEILREENQIQVKLFSPIKYIEERHRNSDIFYSSTGSMKGNGYLRKAHYMFGWDWGPQLPDMGIFRDVYLEYHHKARLKELRVSQEHEKGCAVVRIGCPAELLEETQIVRQVRILEPGGRVFEKTLKDKEEREAEFRISQPKLWWPNGYGEQPLYKVEVILSGQEEILDKKECYIGLRTVTVSTEKDQWGKEFAFVVNGQKMFAMGANYIPEDNILSRVTKERSERLIQDCARANFNCIRIWGGGYYPQDALYDACDRYGILVWQDLMFACNVYDLDQEFEENILAETRDNIKRIRHHACLALYCGNNEMEWGWRDWGRLEGHRSKYKADYIKIFELLLPREVKKYDDQTFYWLSSPSSGGSFDDPNDWNRGDNHYWEVWHSNKPFTEYRSFYFRFCSEFGFQSFPHKKTIESFSLPEDRNIFSEVMESHQKNGQANTKIFSYISGYYKYPKDLESIAYISQILQLKAIQYGVEHWRQNWGRCMGSIYWQLNDCWPVASWASIDYYGRWKALHYGAKRFYSRYMASACEKEELSTEITYYILNESFEERDGVLEIALLDKEFSVLHQEKISAHTGAFESKAVKRIDLGEWISKEEQKRNVFARYRLWEKGICVSQGTTLFVKPKYFEYDRPKYEVSVEEEPEQFVISIKSQTFANYVELDLEEADCVFSDNYFDLTDQEGQKVTVRKEELPEGMGAEEIRKQLRIKSVAESF